MLEKKKWGRGLRKPAHYLLDIKIYLGTRKDIKSSMKNYAIECEKGYNLSEHRCAR